MASIVWRFGTELFARFWNGFWELSRSLLRLVGTRILSRRVLVLSLLTLLDLVIVCVFLSLQSGHRHY